MAYYCGRCGTANPEDRSACEQCGIALETATNARLTAVVLNELSDLRREGVLAPSTHERLQARYQRRLMDFLRPAPAYAPAPAPVAPAAAPPPIPSGPAPSPVPAWLVEQAPNLLLYLGAFLVVVAALIFASTSRETISGAAQVALLASITVGFLGVGWLCYRFPRVRIAGYTFVAVGALLVPLNFAAAYNFVLEEEGIAGDAVWLWASVYCALFYVVLAVLGLGLLYGFMAQAALVSAVAAAIAVGDLPP